MNRDHAFRVGYFSQETIEPLPDKVMSRNQRRSGVQERHLMFKGSRQLNNNAVTDLRRGGPAPHPPPPPHGPKNSQFHAVLWVENLTQSYVGAPSPPPRGLVRPPMGNPGSAPEMC